MNEEKIGTGEEQGTDENQETESQETEVDDSQESESQETQDESDAQEAEESDSEEGELIDDFGEWGGQFNLPETIDSPEKLAESYSALLPELKRNQSEMDLIRSALQAQGYASVEDFIKRQPIQPQPASQPVPRQDIQGPLLPSAVIDDAIRRGTINSEYAEDYRTQARMYDPVLQQVYQTMGEMFRYFEPLMGQTSVLAQRTQSQDWLRFNQTNKGFERKEVEEYQTKHNFDTLDQAAAAMMSSDPKRFADLQKKMETKAEKKARKKLRMGKAFRGQKVRDRSSKGKPKLDGYVRGDGQLNSAKLDADRDAKKISDEEHGQICDLYTKSLEV